MASEVNDMRECLIEDCHRRHLARNYCRLHYDRLRKGLPLEPSSKLAYRPAIVEYGLAKIPLGVDAKDGHAVVDEEFAWLDQYKWFEKKGYAVRNSDYKKGEKRHTIRMHRYIVNTPENQETDHKNGNKLDNRIANLRISTKNQNQWNRKKQKGSSKYKGVTWDKKEKQWRAQIQVNKKKIILGRFADERSAGLAYLEAAHKYFGDFAKLD